MRRRRQQPVVDPPDVLAAIAAVVVVMATRTRGAWCPADALTDAGTLADAGGVVSRRRPQGPRRRRRQRERGGVVSRQRSRGRGAPCGRGGRGVPPTPLQTPPTLQATRTRGAWCPANALADGGNAVVARSWAVLSQESGQTAGGDGVVESAGRRGGPAGHPCGSDAGRGGVAKGGKVVVAWSWAARGQEGRLASGGNEVGAGVLVRACS